ncbi:hypothetical protein P691DRAFT_769269 [Macrolepiota fuliginosa MF-IS2]|uniref:DUF4219 domain-containing protein n=1 Tax=Macrolepiota fuliginosa MF-IS2 TaxID=1400762 RepID=A0A9P6BUC6_9AGAR|nr:hypothetical protein P691DRAFT_769269 [Macrolepiota fuliginosa MF-IS2]
MGPTHSSVSDVWLFQKLTGQNYYTWSEQMRAALQARFLWQYVARDFPQPPKSPLLPPAAKSATRSTADPNDSAKPEDCNANGNNFYSANYNDSTTQGLIKGTLDVSQWGHVSSLTTLKEMWDQLYQLHFVTRRDVNVHYFIQEIWHKHWDEHVLMSNHIGHMISLQQHILDCGTQFKEIYFINAILISLPFTNKWKNVRQSLFSHGSKLTLDMTIGKLTSVYDHDMNDKELE